LRPCYHIPKSQLQTRPAGRETSTTNRNGDPGGGIATTLYDAASNIVGTIDPAGDRTTFTFDAANRQAVSFVRRSLQGSLVSNVQDSWLALPKPVAVLVWTR